MLLAVLMVLAAAPMSFAAGSPAAEAPVNPEALRTDDRHVEAPDPDEIVTVMVKLKGSPVAAVTKDVRSQDAANVTALLKAGQDKAEKRIAELFTDADMKINFRYQLLFNGFSISMPRRMIEKVAALDEVEKAYIAPAWNAPTAMVGENDRLSSSVGFINADDAWNAGYTGKGTTIAILDTGAVVAHNAFSTAPSGQKMSSSSVSSLLANNNMQCEQLYSGTLSASGLYYSGKIPFRFDYAGKDTDVSHSDAGSDHGSHVAGIAAGYYSGSSYTGVAKDAQLVIMKVFGSSGGAGWDTIMAALEDCVTLNVDAVNMSLGSGVGYTSDDAETDEVLELMAQHGINLACAAGNDGSSSGTQYYGSSYKTYALAMNPDNGIIGSPATYTNSLAVACCQKSSSSMVYFSSHGTTADLKIKPEVTAPGYNIYSARDSSLNGSTTGYGTMSGTSMSCPHIAGCMALMTNYVNTAFPSLTGKAKTDMVNRLLMCTANPVSNVSPRTQGAGIVDMQKAITTKAYVTVDGCDRPKLEIGDDPQKTGVYTLSFNVVNFGSSALSYTVGTTVLTENTTTATVNSQSGVRVLSGSNRNIASYATVSGDTSVTVPANSTKKVTITVTLSSSIKSELDSLFPHGIYVDGVITLSGTVNLAVPWLSFYGNWNEASVFDRYTYIDEIQGVNKYNIHTYQAEVGAITSGSSYMLFGANPYITSSDWLADRCTLSPNGDTYYDKIDKLTYDLIRNAGEGGIKIFNEDTGEVYLDVDLSYMPKAWNYPNGNSSAAFYHSSDNIGDLFTSWAPTGLAEGTHIVFDLYHYLDNPGFTPEQNECAEIRLPMTIDNTAPEVTAWSINGSNSSVTVHDEHYAAWIGVYSNAACTTKITEQAITPSARGEYTTVEFSTTASTVYVKVGDYGHNTSSVITLTGEGGSTDPIDITGMTLSPDPAEVLVGSSVALSVVKVPANANNYEIEWTSSNPAVATVVGSRNSASVTGVRAGTAVITATATNIETKAVVTASATVNVTEFEGFILADQLEVGGQYIIASGNYAVGNTVYSSNHYLTAKGVTVNSDNTVTVPSTVDVNSILWEIESGTASAGYTFRNVGNSKYMGLDSSEYLYPSDTAVAWLYSGGDLNNQIDSEGYYYLTLGSSSAYFTTSKNTNGLIRFYKYVTASAPEPVYYTVTFKDWDGTVLSTQQVEEGTAATAPADPTREGYTFTGWDVAFNNVTSDLVVTAQYTINTYTVTFKDWDGTVLSTQTVEHGSAATAPADPTRDGYTFAGWDVAFNNVTSDLVVTATYTENQTPAGLLGDVNCDGKVDMGDISALSAYLLGKGELTAQGLANADASQNGAVDSSDLSAIFALI